MISVDFINIDNAKLLGRLLPFWARGKTISLLLQAILSPIKSTHDTFKVWAFERYVECHITAQKASLEWYLKYKLQSHFANPDDNFFIAHGNDGIPNMGDDDSATDMNLSCFSTGEWENGAVWNNELLWVNGKDVSMEEGSDIPFNPHDTNVYAPEIIDTISYDHEDYERDIRNIMSKFMINFNKINIVILKTRQI